jgi:hypothetical protein
MQYKTAMNTIRGRAVSATFKNSSKDPPLDANLGKYIVNPIRYKSGLKFYPPLQRQHLFITEMLIDNKRHIKLAF